MDTLQNRFEEAIEKSKLITNKPDNETLLQLYALYKQATIGNAAEKGDYNMFDFIAKAKHETWRNLQGKHCDEAMEDYVALVNSLK